LTQEQQLARLLVLAIHRLGGHLEATEELLGHMQHYNIVWEHTEPVKDSVGIKLTLKANDILIAHVDGGCVSVVV
jgi:hypothetical protein